MAVGLDFLSKTKLGGMKDIMAPKTGAAGNLGNAGASQSIFGNNQAAGAKEKQSLGNMNTSDLIKYVYENNGGNVDIQDKTGGKDDKNNKDNVKLPAIVEYGNEKFPNNAKNLDDLVKEIANQTGDSTMKIKSELKRKYATTAGASKAGQLLNMQA